MENRKSEQKPRPRWHYTPQKGYMGDPDGPFYDAHNKTWHLQYQYLTEAAPTRCDNAWGHAVSRDLIHWQERAPVLSPDGYGIIASGSVVYAPELRRFVALYTSMDLPARRQAVCAAYSADGDTYEKVCGGAPVLNSPSDEWRGDFRDPKAVRVADGYLMAIGGGRVQLFYSRDLLHWEYQSTVQNVASSDASIEGDMRILQKYLPRNDPFDPYLISECPDLFPLMADDGKQKWVLSGGGVFYTVGELARTDGKYAFVPQTPKRRFCHAYDFFSHYGEGYASQSFFGDPYGRRIFMHWLTDTTADAQNGWEYNGVQSLPTQVRLVRNGDEYILRSELCDEAYRALRFAPVMSGAELSSRSFCLRATMGAKNGQYLKLQSDMRLISLCVHDGVLRVQVQDARRTALKEFAWTHAAPVTVAVDEFVCEFLLNGEYFSSFAFGDGALRLSACALELRCGTENAKY